MSNADLARVNDPHRGFVGSDFGIVKPNTVLVEPCELPERVGSIIVPGSSLGPASCRILYRVIAAGPYDSTAFAPGETGLFVQEGAVVVPRNGMFDPVGPNLFAVDVRHVLGVARPGLGDLDVEDDATLDPAEMERAA